jgi:malonyl CoA-acyl carrier protein transacylase
MTLKVIMFPGQGSQFKGMGEQLIKPNQLYPARPVPY